MFEDKLYVVPNPIIDLREMKALDALNQEYEKLTTPGSLSVCKFGYLNW